MYNKKIAKNVFHFSGKYWWKNIKYIPLYFKRIHFLIKNGYDEYALWETFDWFTTTMRDILTKYAESKVCHPVLDDNLTLDENAELWDKEVSKMIVFLDNMDENNYKVKTLEDEIKAQKQMDEAKDEFFKMFSKYFYNLWD